MHRSLFVYLTLAIALMGSESHAIGVSSGGGYSIGFELGVVDSSQPQLNQLIKTANTREGGISTSELNSAYEAGIQFMYRFQGSIYAMLLRPSFFYESESGTGAGGAFKYGLQGFTVFPMLRLYPLENEFMKFYMQFGLGYGRVNGTIEENDRTAPGHATVDFAGGAFGSLVGLGAEFCFTSNHCISLEGNYRYLTYDRMLSTDSSGSFDTANGSLSQWTKGQEVELNGEDLQARMGGLMFMAGYNYWF